MKHIVAYVKRELNLKEHCRRYNLPLWQCPQMLFVITGLVTIGSLILFYELGKQDLDPFVLAFIAIGITLFLFLQAFIIIRSFERMAEANHVRNTLTNLYAHQLRGPVTAAGWTFALLDEKHENIPEHLEHPLSVLRDATSRIQGFATSLMGIARLGEVKQGRVGALSLTEVFRELARTSTAFAKEHGVELMITQEYCGAVRADREQLFFVFSQLLDMAVLSAEGISQIEVQCSTDDKTVTVRITSSTGKVVSEEHRGKVKTVLEEGRAAGDIAMRKGLSSFLLVAHQIVERSNGTVSLAQNEAGENWFMVTLPAAEDDAEIAEV